MAEKVISDALFNATFEQDKPDHYATSQHYCHTQQSSHPPVGYGVAPHGPNLSNSRNINFRNAQNYVGNVPNSGDQPTYTNMDNHFILENIQSHRYVFFVKTLL